ncbi:MAG: hypothetical protein CMO01_09480 [Thalassobius sp.]|nr:hypothetical protein [Thalassovita sp.]
MIEKKIKTNNKLFVYGTLMTGFDNPYALQLHRSVGKVVKASIKGELYIVSNWHFEYPLAVFDEHSQSEIKGEVLEIENNLEELLEVLDKYEGIESVNPDAGEYVRAEIPVSTENGTEICWAYINNKPFEGLARLESGDFRAYLKNKI